ncbi:integrase core domain protein-like protein, partial [Leptotrombidium deliense]
SIREKYFLRDGVLFLRQENEDEIRYRLCAPAAIRKAVIESYHDDIISGHLGFTKSYYKIKLKYFWPKMRHHIKHHILSCASCQTRKGICDRPAGNLQPIRPKNIYETVGIDVLGRFPKSHHGNRYVIVCTDYASRYAETIACEVASAETMCNFFMRQIVLRHGAPSHIISDRGSCFIAELTEMIFKLTSTKQNDYLQKMRREALDYLKQSQTKNKELYDRRHRTVKFEPGEYVYVKTPTRKVGLSEKLLHQFYGPYKVIKQVTPVDYLVENHRPESKKKLTRDVVHIYRMKRFIERDEYFIDDYEEFRSVSPPDSLNSETVRTVGSSSPIDVLDDRELTDIFFDVMIDDLSDAESDTTEVYDLDVLENVELPDGSNEENVTPEEPAISEIEEVVAACDTNDSNSLMCKEKLMKTVRFDDNVIVHEFTPDTEKSSRGRIRRQKRFDDYLYY